MEQRTRNILQGASALEFAILAKTLLAPPSNNKELHKFADADAQKSKSFQRLWMLFLFVLGGSRYAVASSTPAPSKELRNFTLGIHVLELLFFYSEALDQQEPLTPDQKGFLAILWALPYILIAKVPTL